MGKNLASISALCENKVRALEISRAWRSGEKTILQENFKTFKYLNQKTDIQVNMSILKPHAYIDQLILRAATLRKVKDDFLKISQF